MIYLFALVIDIGFGVWAALGRAWYWYVINLVILFSASGILNTSYIEWVTRSYSVLVLHGVKGIREELALTILTSVLWAVAYGIGYVVLKSHIAVLIFVLLCLALSTVVAFIDHRFAISLERTKDFDKKAELLRKSSKS